MPVTVIIQVPLVAVLPSTPVIETCFPVLKPWPAEVISMGLALVAPVIPAGESLEAAATSIGAERCNKEICKEAMKQLTASGRLVYTFYDGSYIEMPSEERKGE